jgi:hypothetical protein
MSTFTLCSNIYVASSNSIFYFYHFIYMIISRPPFSCYCNVCNGLKYSSFCNISGIFFFNHRCGRFYDGVQLQKVSIAQIRNIPTFKRKFSLFILLSFHFLSKNYYFHEFLPNEMAWPQRLAYLTLNIIPYFCQDRCLPAAARPLLAGAGVGRLFHRLTLSTGG